jgi:hypothetical protein
MVGTIGIILLGIIVTCALAACWRRVRSGAKCRELAATSDTGLERTLARSKIEDLELAIKEARTVIHGEAASVAREHFDEARSLLVQAWRKWRNWKWSEAAEIADVGRFYVSLARAEAENSHKKQYTALEDAGIESEAAHSVASQRTQHARI